MINQIKNNTKIKIISLLSALVLWLYVMAVVDPEETRLIEDIPVTISTMREIKEKDLVIYPEVELTANIYITGKISEIQKVKKENIHVYGQISTPIEGRNKVFLKANIEGSVTHKFKEENFTFIDLEKLVTEKRSIDIDIENSLKNNIDTLNQDKDSLRVSGPRSLVDKVQKVVANLDGSNKVDDFSSNLTLYPVDGNGDRVEGVTLSDNKVSVNVTLLKQKTVPIKAIFNEYESNKDKINDYKITPGSIIIKGKKDIIENINYINTKPIDLSNITDNISKNIELDIPSGIKSDVKYISIKLEAIKMAKEEISYTSEDIQLKNVTEGFDISTLNLPTTINVSFENSKPDISIIKSDILLYIDLNSKKDDETYEINYESNKDISNVVISPNKVSIK